MCVYIKYIYIARCVAMCLGVLCDVLVSFVPPWQNDKRNVFCHKISFRKRVINNTKYDAGWPLYLCICTYRCTYVMEGPRFCSPCTCVFFRHVLLGVLWRAKHLLFYDFIRHSTRHTERSSSEGVTWSNLTCE